MELIIKDRMHKIYFFQNILLYIYIVFFPYENWNLFLGFGMGSILKFIGIAYITSTFVFIPFILNRFLIYIISPLFFLFLWFLIRNSFELKDSLEFLIPFFNNIILLIAIFLHLSYGGLKLFNNIIILFALNIAILSIILTFSNNIEIEFIDERLFFMGQNPNDFSYFLVLSIIFIYHLLTHLKLKKVFKIILISFLPFIFIILLKTGSRGGFLMLIISIFILLLFNKVNIKIIIIFAIIALTFTMFYKYIFVEQNILLERLSNNEDNLNLGGRKVIWQVSYNNFKENFLIGSGFKEYKEVMLNNFGMFRSSHNAYLYISSITGIIGIVFFLIFLYRIFKVGLKFNIDKSLFIALFAIQIIFLSKSGSFFGLKILWFVFSLLISLISLEIFKNKNV